MHILVSVRQWGLRTCISNKLSGKTQKEPGSWSLILLYSVLCTLFLRTS